MKSADTALEQAEQPPKVVAPTDVKKAEATARSFLATCLEVEAKQRAKNQATPTAATAEIVLHSEVAAEVAAAEAAIETVLEIATEVVIEIEQEQVEAAAKAELLTDLNKAEFPARAFLEARIEMEVKQRSKRAAKATTIVQEEEQKPAPTDTPNCTNTLGGGPTGVSEPEEKAHVNTNNLVL